ncbi:MAG: hypothetical protein GQ532_11140 [Methylomarinum sp.]|nr:hypothetical protein [Methylomarinum sp.]
MKKDVIKPNFFIVGAAKTGTTSLWMYLKQHPGVFMPESIVDKEPSYYCDSYGHTDYDKYLQLFKSAGCCKAVGEASNAYLTSPESANWIRKEVPDAKIIIVLRNPVDRAYSLYRWMVNHGYERVYPFERALEIENERKYDVSFYQHNPQYYYNYLYFESGLYYEQLERYFNAFPAEQIKVILLDDLNNKSVETVQDIYHFLECEPSFVPTIKVYNKAEMCPASVTLHFKLRTFERRFYNKAIGKMAHYLFEMNMKIYKQNWSKLSFSTGELLLKKYQSELEAIESLISRDLTEWKKSLFVSISD